MAKLISTIGNFEIPLTQTGNGYSYEGQGQFDGYWLRYGFNTYLNGTLVSVTNFTGTN